MHIRVRKSGIRGHSACRFCFGGVAAECAGLTLATVVSNLEQSPAGGDRFVLTTYVGSEGLSKPLAGWRRPLDPRRSGGADQLEGAGRRQ